MNELGEFVRELREKYYSLAMKQLLEGDSAMYEYCSGIVSACNMITKKMKEVNNVRVC